ncbi:energy-coupling factor ABC transporter ATP-binding protein [Pseudoramibacter faecis]|uniref:ABC transporter ATP-binding protein n=1 Tax=Pseudoramibacter faecis TaxID=3108534 RepID=UPI002E75AC0E|nr:energy-coupling factor ABC transporter ATP-binding protein [Pseudoramibacter sp. HA2172]
MIEFEKISFSYRNSEGASLRELHLNIPKGQCVLLCGASGCGKTTLTRLVNGLIPHFFEGRISGKATVKGMNVAETEIATLSDSVGTVFQNPRTQFFNTDTDSEIVFGLENRTLAPEALKQQLERVVKDLHIEKLRGRSIFELSGGEKQKIAFASVYAANPDIFVLDEPSSNLDFHSVLELKKLIERIKRQGKTIIIAEHRLWYLTDLADRVLLMKDGQIFRNMSMRVFCRLPAERIQNMGLRCRNFSEIETNINIKKISERILELQDISVKYGKHTILQNISFTANGGEIVAVTGANGAGKTTLARTVCGLLKQKSGSILVNGRNLTAKARIQKSYMVMQDVGHQLFTDRVKTECTLGTKTVNETCIDETLSMLSLSEWKDRHPLSLSGGQKQRLAVAISLLCDKEILIFDEPTSGLDLKSMREVGTMTERLSEQGKILFVITHDIEFIKTICSRVLLLSGGKMIADLKGKEKGNIENYILAGGDRNE